MKKFWEHLFKNLRIKFAFASMFVRLLLRYLRKISMLDSLISQNINKLSLFHSVCNYVYLTWYESFFVTDSLDFLPYF